MTGLSAVQMDRVVAVGTHVKQSGVEALSPCARATCHWQWDTAGQERFRTITSAYSSSLF